MLVILRNDVTCDTSNRPYDFTGDASILSPMTFGVDQGKKYQLFQKLVMLENDQQELPLK